MPATGRQHGGRGSRPDTARRRPGPRPGRLCQALGIDRGSTAPTSAQPGSPLGIGPAWPADATGPGRPSAPAPGRRQPGSRPAVAVLAGRRCPRFRLSSVEAESAQGRNRLRAATPKMGRCTGERHHRRPELARPDRRVHRPGRPAQGAGHRDCDVLLRLRPDCAWAAHRQPGPAADHAAAAAGRAPADRDRRRRDGTDRRPRRQVGRARAEPARAGRRVGRADPGRGQPVPGLHARTGRRDRRQQPGLDRAAVRDRLPARHRQALPGEPDAVPRGRPRPAGGRRDQLHRVQLPDPAGQRLPRAAQPVRLHAPARRQRPVGQPGLRRRPDPAGRPATRCTRWPRR